MLKSKLSRKITIVAAACLMSLGIGLGATLGATLPADGAVVSHVGKRVEFIDLYERYLVDYVVGPVDVKKAGEVTGAYTKRDGLPMTKDGTYYYYENKAHAVRNSDGDCLTTSGGYEEYDENNKSSFVYTNNIYGIPAEKYFNVENYIYAPSTSTTRTLYGWNKGIQASYWDYSSQRYSSKIAQNGELLPSSEQMPENEEDAGATGIYVEWSTVSQTTRFGTNTKYALIVPDDVTTVGRGNGAFTTADGKAYYHNTSGNDPAVSGTADFTDFSSFILNMNMYHNAAPYFWQPRERLVGVFFGEKSKLESITGADTSKSTPSGNRTTPVDGWKTKAAFEFCDNMRFLVLPSKNEAAGTKGLGSIGARAFRSCSQLVDVNIPSSVTTINTVAFQNCSSIAHLTFASAFSTASADAFNGCNSVVHVVKNGASGIPTAWPSGSTDIFVMAGAPVNGKLDGGRYGFIFTNSGTTWTALELAGATGEEADALYVFPKRTDFTNDSDRRSKVLYDYLNADGKKVNCDIPDESMNLDSENKSNITYTIRDNFASDTWCQNVIIPEACRTIGASAFARSHLQYLETYATSIGASAFATQAGSTSVDTSINQWVYIHGVKSGSGYVSPTIGDGAFGTNVRERNFVFEDKATYNALNGKFTALGAGGKYWMIPVKVTVQNDDDTALTLSGSDMKDRFFIDSDYVENAAYGNGTHTYTYTKRISNHNFTYVKGKTGKWTQESSVYTKQANPALPNMASTKWYSNGQYSTAVSSFQETVTNASPNNYGTVTEFNFYARYLKTPTLANANYDFNEALDENFYTHFGLSSNDYIFTETGFTYADGGASATPTTLHNAGTYQFTLRLNTKWGVWSDDYIRTNASKLSATITINRKKIAMHELANLPEFTTSSGARLLSPTAIYRYEDGWYGAEQKDLGSPWEEKKVENAVTYYTGAQITIKFEGDKAYTGEGGATGYFVLPSGAVITSYGTNYASTFAEVHETQINIRVPYISQSIQYSNYIFSYSLNENDGSRFNNTEYEQNCLKIVSKQNNSFTIIKQWYIVADTNMFVSAENSDDMYAPIGIPASAEFASAITVNKPAVKYSTDSTAIQFALNFTPAGGGAAVSLTGTAQRTLNLAENATGADTLGYYINSSMPAGTYALTLSCGAVNLANGSKYDAISTTYTFTITEKPFSTGDVAAIHNAVRGDAVKNPPAGATELEKYLNAYPLGVDEKGVQQIHTDLTKFVSAPGAASVDLIENLNRTLQYVSSSSREGYWATTAANDYYGMAAITYNREGSGNTYYLDAPSLSQSLSTANTYTIYYSLTAKNYQTIGGANAADRQARGFRTTLYVEVSIKGIYKVDEEPDYPYFRDVTYNGDAAHTLVPSSQYYSYSFDESDYINARKGAIVTLTLYNPTLARWGAIDPNWEHADKFEVSEDGTKLYVKYNINPATNSFTVAPSIPPWAYFGFDREINFITYGLTYADKTNPWEQMYFRIGTKNGDTYNWIDVKGTFTVGGTVHSEYFSVDQNGQVSAAVANILNKLPVGTNYYLNAYAKATADGNVAAYDSAVYSNFRILTTSNRWTKTPGMTGWDYDAFASKNFIPGETAFPSTITYTLYKVTEGDQTTQEQLLVFENLSQTGLAGLSAGQDVTAFLKKLAKGSYKIVVNATGDGNNYGPIDYDITFNVAEASNAWTKGTVISGWTYGEFDANNANMFTAGTATFGPVLFTVQVIVGNNPGASVGSGFENLTASELKKALAGLNAGSYNLHIFVNADAYGNFTPISEDIRFNVEKANNSWVGNAPTITGWVYGSAPHKPTPENASAKYDTGAITYRYFHASLKDDGEWEEKGEVTDLATAPAGNYLMVVTVPENTNYNKLEQRVPFTISKQANGWLIEPDGRLDWTWGATASLEKSALYTATAKDMSTGLKYVIVATDGREFEQRDYTVNVDENGEKNQEDLKKLLSGLSSLPAGEYKITVSIAESLNYGALSKETTSNVSKATFRWAENHEPQNATWNWADSEENKLAKIVTPQAINVKGHTISLFNFDVRVGSASANPTTYYSIGELQTYLKGANAGVYYITVKPVSGNDDEGQPYDINNYNAFSKTITITIEKYVNNWTENAPKADYGEWEYQTSPIIGQAKAAFGVVEYYKDEACNVRLTDGNDKLITTAEELMAWIKTLGASNTPYFFYTCVKGTENYTELKQKSQFVITGIKSTWDNQDKLQAAGDGTYEKTFSDNIDYSDVVLPEGKSDGTTEYRVKYTNFDGQKTESMTYNTTEQVMYWLKNKKLAGTYTITAVYEPDNKSFTDLTYVVTVNVARAKPQWAEQFKESYSGDFGEIPTSGGAALFDPRVVTNNYTATFEITVTSNDDASGSNLYYNSSLTLTAFVKTLNSVATFYVVTCRVQETDNYEGISMSCILYINRITNTWQDVDGYTGAQWDKGITWTFYRKQAVAVSVPEALIANDTLVITLDDNALPFNSKIALNNYLATANLAAGEHTLTFTIEGKNNNYNTLTSFCFIRIDKIGNSWVTGEKIPDYNGRGKVVEEQFEFPAATVQTIDDVDLRRFDVVQINGTYTAYNLTATQFRNVVLNTLANGAYRITVRVGGNKSGYEEEITDKVLRALEKYNADYEGITATFAITLTPNPNNWGDPFEIPNWYRQNFDITKVKMPTADFGSETIVYTLSGDGITTQTFKAVDYRSNQNAFDALINAIKDFKAGSYTVIASIEATDIYAAPASTLRVDFVVSLQTNAWGDSFNVTNWEWGKFTAQDNLSKPTADHGIDTIVYKVRQNGVIIQTITAAENGNSAENAFNKLAEYLGSLPSGAYALLWSIEATDDYEGLSEETKAFSIGLAENGWLDPLEIPGWTWGEFDSQTAKMPTAKHGSDFITYTLTGDGIDKPMTFSGEGKVNGNKTAFNELLLQLAKLDAGVYNVSASIDVSDTYNTMPSATTSFTVALADNRWEKKPSATELHWTWGQLGTIEFEAKENNKTLKITVNNTTEFTDNLSLNSYLEARTAGEYVIVATVEATKQYKELTFTLTLNIEKVVNAWTSTLAIATHKGERSKKGWEWGTEIDDIVAQITFPVSTNGSSALVSIKLDSTIVLEATVNYLTSENDGTRSANANDVRALASKLYALNAAAGVYTIEVTVNETTTYTNLTSGKVEFYITKAKNWWIVAPKVEEFNFGGDVAYPSSQPRYGDGLVTYQYAYKAGDYATEKPAADAKVWSDTLSYQAGWYWLKATVEDNPNYDGLVEITDFQINEGQNSWVAMPSVVEWTWNGYDALVNLFSGSARSGGKVDFTITYDKGSNPATKQKKDRPLEQGDFIWHVASNKDSDISKLTAFTLEESKDNANLFVVNSKVANLLNGLRPATYVLTVHAEGGESLTSLSGWITFTIGKAENGWTTAPSVRYFTYGEDDSALEDKILTEGVPYYGTVTYQIASGSYSSAKFTKIADLKAALKELNVGSYVLRSWVEVDSGPIDTTVPSDPYKALYSESVPYQTMFVVSAATNAWRTGGKPQTSVTEYYAVIQSWDEATFKTKVGDPQAENGTAVFTLYNKNYTALNTTPYSYSDYVKAVKALAPGEYIVRITVKADNYVDLTEDMSLIISRYNSAFTTVPDSLQGKWQENDTLIYDAEIVAKSFYTVGQDRTYVNHSLPFVFVFRGETYATLDLLRAELKTYASGSYQVTIRVYETNEYEGVSQTLQLDIEAGDNDWVPPTKEDDLPLPGDSFAYHDTNESIKDEEGKIAWTWSREVDWKGVLPRYGESVIVKIVRAGDEDNVLKFFTLNPKDETQRGLVSAYLSKLDVGEYIMIITTPSGDNWKGIDDEKPKTRDAEQSVTRIAFEVKQSDNEWVVEPAFNIKETSERTYTWTYGTVVTVASNVKALHGAYKVVYRNTHTHEQWDTMPTDVSDYAYEAIFTVVETPNYKGIDEYVLTFRITGDTNLGFTVVPGVTAWVWNGYDRKVNLFTGKAASGGAISYAIFDEAGVEKISKFDLVDENGVRNENDNLNLYVREGLVPALNALKAGTYTLRVYVEACGNYVGFETSLSLTIGEYINSWDVSPRISNWAKQQWKQTENMPIAVAHYGDPEIWIRSEVSNTDMFHGIYYKATDTYWVEFNHLNDAEAGWYIMSVDVQASPGQYTALHESNYRIQVFIRGTDETLNSWDEYPFIEGWTADIDEYGNPVYNMPTGSPVRGKMYFVFYEVVGGVEQKTPVGAGIDAKTIKPEGTNEEIYSREFHIPTAPGEYRMYAYAENGVEKDFLTYPAVTFNIRSRTNTWLKSVNISSVLELSDYYKDPTTWGVATAEANLPSEIEYVYFTEQGTRLGTSVPIVPGKYFVRAYARARYSVEIFSDMPFEVRLSKNYWINDTSPSIENWSEEFNATSPNPVGEAAFGDIEYTYINNKTGEVLTSKPTEAGNYTLVARVELAGYEVLEAHYDFVIEPAFDMTLITICIILAAVASALTVVVITFAIKRNKEN